MGTTLLEDFMAMKPEIDSTSEKDIVAVGMPFRHYLQGVMLERERLERNREYLEANGMDFAGVERIPVQVGACREIYSEVSMINFPTAASKEAWEKGKEEAENLMYDLKAAMDYAFHDNPDLLGRVSEIRQGSSNADFIQDLSDAHVLCRENRALLEAIGYDMTNVDRAGVLSKELSGLLAQATLDKSTSPELRIDRDKCFTLLKKNIDAAIRRARYIYRNDRERAAQFMIRPPRRTGARAKKGTAETEAAPA